jgi:hypothetical protein
MTAASTLPVAASGARATLTNQIEALVGRLHPPVVCERRNDDRIAIPVLFRLTPLDANRQPIESQAAIVVGKNISRRGISFFHERPTPYRRAIIELAQPGLGSFAAEIDVNWCRFQRPGWYESGGRLIRLASRDLHNTCDFAGSFVVDLAPLVRTFGEFDSRSECHV